MNLTHTSHRHACLAALAPAVEGVGGVKEPYRFAVAAAHQVGILVHIGTLRVAEGTPAYRVEVGLLSNVEVTVHSVKESTMIYPAMLRGVERYEVAAANIYGTRTFESYVANNKILAFLEKENS